MKNVLLMPLAIYFATFGTSCANTPPSLEPCVIISDLEAYCIPQDPSKAEYKRKLVDMVGDFTLTADEVAALKKWIKSSIEDTRFNKIQEID